MKRLLFLTLSLAMLIVWAAPSGTRYVRVGPDARFYIGDSLYSYVGANLWYASFLASEGRGGDRSRLSRELDELQRLGVTNLRVLAGAEGSEDVCSHVRPVMQPRPGEYNDTLLRALDYLIAELERRDMKAVIYLCNAWEWSGGYGTYLEWAGYGKCPDPVADGYRQYVNHVSSFVVSDSAKSMAARHIRNVVGRVSTVTGRPYSESPAIMSWQIANEPRAFSSDSLHKECLAQWLSDMAALIKSIDSNHLVSTGSEGRYGCENDIDLWTRIHSDPNIDYAVIHLWPLNWGWVHRDSLLSGLPDVYALSHAYITSHAERMQPISRPLVLEEFGYPRDAKSYLYGSPTIARDSFYNFVLGYVGPGRTLAGCNFWGWGGEAVPAHEMWLPGDPYTGDPAQEPQGLYSIFSADTTTTAVISRHSRRH